MTKPPSPRPLSIKVIAILYAFSILAQLKLLEDPQKFFFFFSYIHGLPAQLYFLVRIFVFLFLAIGLWRLNNTARLIAIWHCSYESLNSISSVLIPIGYGILTGKRVDATGWGFFIIPMRVAWAGFYGLILRFLITRKSAFVKPTTPTQAST